MAQEVAMGSVIYGHQIFQSTVRQLQRQKFFHQTISIIISLQHQVMAVVQLIQCS